jgi:dTDP-4-dehydrorhamnose 3,5-epimerase
MTQITTVPTGIDGTKLTKLTIWEDERGAFWEAFRASWFADRQRWVQWNVSRSSGSVVRGLHFHKLQTDYWIAVAGKLQVALVDLRPKSPTYKTAKCLTLDSAEPEGLYIPPGVLHGYRVMSEATIMYLVDVEYTGKDEYGVRWNDPALGLPASWYDGPEPAISRRDATAPMLAELKDKDRP